MAIKLSSLIDAAKRRASDLSSRARNVIGPRLNVFREEAQEKVKQIPKNAIEGLKRVDRYLGPQASGKVRPVDVVRELPGAAERVLARPLIGLAREIGPRFVQRMGLEGENAARRLRGLPTITSRPPQNTFERVVSGPEPIRPYREEGVETVKQFGGSEATASKYGPVLGLGMLVGDITPGGSGKKQLIQKGLEIVPETGKAIKAAAPLGAVDDFIQNIRLSKIEKVDEIADVLKQTAERYKTRLVAARAGTNVGDIRAVMEGTGKTADEIATRIPQEETVKAAESLGMRGIKRLIRTNPDDFAARVYAINDFVAAKARQVQEIRGALADPAKATPRLQAELQEHMAELGVVMASAVRNNAAAGRALNILKVVRKGLQDPTVEGLIKIQKMAKQYGFDADTIAKQTAALKTPEELYKFARNLYRPKLGDYFREVFYNSLLSAPGTHVVNIVSNSLNALLAPVEATVSGLVDIPLRAGRFRKGFKGERFAWEGAEYLVGMRQGVVEGFRKFGQILARGYTPDDVMKYELQHLPAFRGKVGAVIQQPSRWLVGADALFKSINYSGALHQGAYRMAKMEGKKGADIAARMADLLDNPTEELMKQAGDMAKYRLFQKDPDKITQGILKMRQFGVKGFRPLELVLPFVQTPVNLAKFGLERTPLGFGKALVSKGGNKADAVARAMIGSTAAATVAIMFGEGKITGAAPKEQAARASFYREGKIPYAVKIGDTWYSYQRLEPFNTLISQVASVRSTLEENPDADVGEVMAQLAADTGRNMISQTYLQGINELINAIEDPERYGQDFINGFGKSLVPATALLGTIARSVDTTIRDPQTFTENVMSVLPGVSKSLRPKRGVFGEELQRPGGWLRQIIPYKMSEEKTDQFEESLKDLGDPVGFPGKTARGFSWDTATYDDLLRISGPAIKERVNTEFSRPAWALMPEDKRTKRVKEIVEEERDKARDLLLPVALANYYEIPVPLGRYDEGSQALVVPGIDQRRLKMEWERLKKRSVFKDANRLTQQEYVRSLFASVLPTTPPPSEAPPAPAPGV